MMFPHKREVPPPLVSELAGDGVPVTVACRVLKLARHPYYRWRKAPVTDAEWVQAHRINALHDAQPASRHDMCTFRAHNGVVVLLLAAGSLIFCGAPGKIRTCDTFFRREVLFP